MTRARAAAVACLLAVARAVARLALRLAEGAVDGPWDPRASADVDAVLGLLDELDAARG